MNVDEAAIPAIPPSVLEAKRWAVLQPISDSPRGPFDIVSPSKSERREADVLQSVLYPFEEAVTRVERRDDASRIGFVFGQQDDRTLIEWSIEDVGSHLVPETDLIAVLRRLDSFTEVVDGSHVHTIVRTPDPIRPIHNEPIRVRPGAIAVPIWSLHSDGMAHPRTSGTVRSLSREELRALFAAATGSVPDFDPPSVPPDLWPLQPLIANETRNVQPAEHSTEKLIEVAKEDDKTGQKFKRLLHGHPSPLNLTSEELAPQIFMNMLAFWLRFDAGAMRQQFFFSGQTVENPILGDGTTLTERRIARALKRVNRCYGTAEGKLYVTDLHHHEYKMGRLAGDTYPAVKQ